MSEATRGFFEALMDGAEALSGQLIDRIMEAPAEMAHEAMHQGEREAQELASALFNGSGFVQYGHAADNNQEQAQSISEVMNAARPEVTPPQQEMGGQGMEM